MANVAPRLAETLHVVIPLSAKWTEAHSRWHSQPRQSESADTPIENQMSYPSIFYDSSALNAFAWWHKAVGQTSRKAHVVEEMEEVK